MYNHYNQLLMSNPGGAARASKDSHDAGSLVSSSSYGSSVASSAMAMAADGAVRYNEDEECDFVDLYASIVCNTAGGRTLFYRTTLDAGGQCWG